MTQTQASIQKVEDMEEAAKVSIVRSHIALRDMRKNGEDMQSSVGDIKMFCGLLVERDGKLFFAEEIK